MFNSTICLRRIWTRGSTWAHSGRYCAGPRKGNTLGMALHGIN